MALKNVMRVDNGNVVDGSLIPTAGYGGMIKISGTTLADLITALNGMTEDQKTRCEILLYLNGESITNFFVLKRYNKNAATVGSETHDIYSGSYDEVTIYDGTTKVAHRAISLHVTNGTTATIRLVSGSNGYDRTSNLTSWSILYQDDSTSGGNTYPASQVIMSDGETSVEDAVDGAAKKAETATDITMTPVSGITIQSSRIMKMDKLVIAQLKIKWSTPTMNETFIITFNGFNVGGNYAVGVVTDSNTKAIGAFILTSNKLYIRLSESGITSDRVLCMTVIGFTM